MLPAMPGRYPQLDVILWIVDHTTAMVAQPGF